MAPKISSTLNFTHQKNLLRNKKISITILIVALLFIIVWQAPLIQSPKQLDSTYRLKNISGLLPTFRYFLYFKYYLDLYPIATNYSPLDFSREGAEDIIKNHGNTLYTEVFHIVRYGEHGRILLYLPYSWYMGSPAYVSVRPVNAFLFIFSLLTLFYAFWNARLPLFGFITVLLIGSNPFQLFETYANENIFSLHITAMIFMLALHIPIIFKENKNKWYPWMCAIITGIFLGSIRQIRSDPVLVILSILFLYATLSRASWKIRSLLSLTLIFIFFSTSLLWTQYFNTQIQKASHIVENAGGHVYKGNLKNYHPVWHTIFCGLGDYDTKYGYRWSDVTAYLYANPILKKKYGINIDYSPSYSNQLCRGGITRTYYDRQHIFYVKFEDIPEYAEIIRDKVLNDISNSPLWYIKIIGKRFLRTLSEITPIQIKFGEHRLRIPFSGYLLLPTVIFLIFIRAWPVLKFVIFPLASIALPLLVFSGGGICNLLIYHITLFALYCAIIYELIIGVISQNNCWYHRKQTRIY